MADTRIPPDREWFAEKIKQAGYATQGEFAGAVGLSGPKWTNSLSGKRRLQIFEILSISEKLRVSANTIYEKLGLLKEVVSIYDGSAISGVVRKDGIVTTVFPFGSFNDAEADFYLPTGDTYEGIYARVETADLKPRLRLGDVIGFWLPDEADFVHSAEELSEVVGADCVLCTDERVLVVGTLYPGSDEAHWTITTASDVQRDVRVLWASPIEMIIPKIVADSRLR